MKLGVYTAVLHDRSLPEALDVIAELGLDAAEINVGGFLPPVHLPVDEILDSQSARDDYLGVFADKGIALAGLNANGNPLHPHPAIGPKHAEDLRRAIRAAGALGQTRVVTMSGLPGGEPGATVPNWVVNAWSSGALDVLEHQWDDVVVPFWREIDVLAAAIEMHPQNVLGRGHDVEFWTRFVDALREVDPDMAINIEHEDTSLGRIEGLQVAAEVLKRAAGGNAPA